MNVSSATSAVSEIEDVPPSRRGREFLKSLEMCVENAKLTDASIRLDFKSVFKKSTEKKKSIKQNSVPFESNVLFDEIKNEFDRQVRELLKEGDVMASLNKLDKIQCEQSKIGPAYRKMPKWRPYGFPEEDLRPYRMRELEKHRRKLTEIGESMETEKKQLLEEITRGRTKIKENEKLYKEKIDEFINFESPNVDVSISDDILRLGS